MPEKDNAPRELTVFTHAKKTCEYIFAITKSAPKQYRWNIIDKVINAGLSIVELLYRANDARDAETRETIQREADTAIKYTSWLVTMGQRMEVFTKHQTEHLGKLILETRRALWAWIKSGSDTS